MMQSTNLSLNGTLNRLFAHQYLSREEARAILSGRAAGRYNESQIASFITVYLKRGVSVEEILGFREALLDLRVEVDRLRAFDPIDIVGTGGDGKNTFNISTAACFVVAGAGYKVLKHGNYGATSVSGASNVMEMHGVRFTSDVDVHRRSLEEAGIAYLHAPLFNPALKTVAPARKALGVRTFFNVLGPLVNPIRPGRQLLGVYDLKMARLYHYIYQESDCDFSIVHSLDGYDEISLTGPFKLIDRRGEYLLSPGALGFSRVDPAELHGGETPAAAAAIFDSVLDHRATPAREDVVIVNAAVAIHTIDPDLSLVECTRQARESLESGRAREMFRRFLSINC
jgi:anthranilate phosphoribosyltransferase